MVCINGHPMLRPRPPRTGATLIELVVALTVFGFIATTCLASLSTAARSYERATLTTDQRTQLAAATQVSNALLAGVSPADGDIIAATDTAVRYWGTIASGVACRIAGADLWIPHGALATQTTLGAAASTPQPGDMAVVWDEGPSPLPSDDNWTRHRVLAASTSAGGCVGGPLAHPVRDASATAWRLNLAPPIDTLRTGAPLHLLRAQRLALYNSAGEWSLGYSETTPAGPWSVIQPAAGPLGPPTAPGQGLALIWVDSTGLPNSTQSAALQVTLRAPTRVTLRTPTGPSAPTDSARRFLALHNRQ